MRVERLFEFRMRRKIVRIVCKFGILLQILLDIWMRIEKVVKILQLLSRDVTPGSVELPLTIHEDSWIFRNLFAYARMRTEKLFQFRMRSKVSRIVDEIRTFL